MSVAFDTECLQCHMGKALSSARALGDEETAVAFCRELMKLYLQAPADAASPWFAPGTAELLHKFYGADLDRFREEKRQSNLFVLERMDRIRDKIAGAEDPIFAALQFAILGNYIDYSALHGEVSLEKLDDMLATALEMELDRDCYARFLQELSRAERLLYLTDNAGEIVFDRIFAEVLHLAFPGLSITFCVRGGPANNDATREDAQAVGLPFPVIDNGNRIPGTQLDQLGPEAKAAMDSADVILAKGQGNVETLFGCGYNIYYAFLVKCSRFIKKFNKPKLTPLFLRERS